MTSGTASNPDVAYVLPSRLDAPAAPGLAEDLRSHMADAAGVKIDISAVALIDTPAIEVLLAADRQLDGQITLTGTGETVSAAMTTLGLAEVYQRWRQADG
ncbi:STAS domain-containing protein [Maricaulis sp. D1M11]|uniref:STAS domain-containing protein n=1 Tax=Maricaulis sp. D1M11 TaxID=3076117 RepID=UPI0039B647CA